MLFLQILQLPKINLHFRKGCGKINTREFKKINIVTGHYGSGKTNVTANLAIELASRGEKVTVVDLDIVNPYFRTADFGELFEGKNIELVKSVYANTNLDIPAISFDLERIATDEGYVFIDVGGDDDGATALGRYAESFLPFAEEIDFFYVVNGYRYLTREAREARELLAAIEFSSHMRATAVINNSNLGEETSAVTVLAKVDFGEEVAKLVNLPLAMVTAPTACKCKELDKVEKLAYNNIYVKQIWQK